MDEKERIRADLQLAVCQAMSTIKELLRQVAEQREVMAETGCKLAVLDNVPDIEGSFEFAAQRGGWD